MFFLLLKTTRSIPFTCEVVSLNLDHHLTCLFLLIFRWRVAKRSICIDYWRRWRPSNDLSFRKIRMAISSQRIIRFRSTSCLIIGWGFRGWRI